MTVCDSAARESIIFTHFCRANRHAEMLLKYHNNQMEAINKLYFNHTSWY